MSRNVQSFFSTKGKRKTNNSQRKSSPAPSVSDLEGSLTDDGTMSEHSRKKQDRHNDEGTPTTEGGKEPTLQEIKSILENMPKKEDLELVKNEMIKITECLTRKVEILESSVFDLQTKNDSLTSEISELKKRNEEFKVELKQRERNIDMLNRQANDNEQHGRSWNVRIFGVEEGQEETTNVCIERCVQLFRNKLGVESITAADVDIAHRIGRRGQGGKPRPVILRFVTRGQRNLVLAARRKLKGSGISVAEDLTMANHQLLKRASDHSATLSAWSSHGKILVKLKNGKIVRLDVGCDVNTTLAKEM